MSNTLQFQNLESAVEASFWHELGEYKINHFKLDDSSKEIWGYFSTGNSEDLPARLCVGSGALSGKVNPPPFSFPVPGIVRNLNTAEAFKELDKNKEFSMLTEKIWLDITSGKAIEEPCLLNKFLMITFADLKKYKYVYWFSFPALNPSSPFKFTSIKSIENEMKPPQIESLRLEYEKYRNPIESTHAYSGVFLWKLDGDQIKIGKLSEWTTFHENGKIQIGFADAGSMNQNPGWMLRNILVLIKKKWETNKLTVICFREIPGKNDISKSIVVEVDMTESNLSSDCPKSVGWEKNSQGKLAPRSIDLAPLMDPLQLASTAIDLNLKLMRWRLIPSLDLEKIANTKCLLLGSGTLGCNVARCLLGWGCRNITMVDNGKVSFSNPVRQSLFTYEDCLNGGRPKGIAAAEALKKIFPGVNSKGYDLSIPMPGHTVTDIDQTKKDVKLLEDLIESHDVTFLLMDTRESRWLPTLIASSKRKIVMNCALGFDTYLVMRHGVPKPDSLSSNLGCYFCNDVVAPTDSMKDRTLDQQCTVTRPGLSYIASAKCVELLISVLQHPQREQVEASSSIPYTERLDHEMGLVPHQIRGFLTHFQNLLIVGKQYDRCTACSPKILSTYLEKGFDFLLQAFNSPSYLEEVAGLTDLHNQTELATTEWDEGSGDDDF